jgi:hypothetical protein
LSVLFAGVVGALLVFVLGLVREKWRSDREQVGILRLLLAEIHHNIAVVQTLEHWRGAVLNIDVRLLPRMKAEVWRDVRVRAAQLLREKLITTLNDYYSPLDNVITLREVQEDPTKLDLSNNVMMDALGKQAERQYTAPPILYVDYALLALQAQNVARKQVEDQLARPGWARYPLTGRVIGFAIRSRTGESG